MKNSPRRPFNPGGASRNNRPFTPNKDQLLDSSGPGGKIRGTPQQIMEKYMTLGRDTLSSGDYVMAESFFQHAEHYRRVITTKREERLERENHALQQTRSPSPEETHKEPSEKNAYTASQKTETPDTIEAPPPQAPLSPGEQRVDPHELPAFLNPHRPHSTARKQSIKPNVERTGEKEGNTEETPKRPRRRSSRATEETPGAKES